MELVAKVLGSLSRGLALCAALAASLSSGCTSMTNPVGDAVPVRRLPPDLLAEPREDKATIPLTALRQPPPDFYRLAPGDILGVYVEGILPATVLGQTPPTPPVYFPGTLNPLSRRLDPALGFPFPIRHDGTVVLPQLKPLQFNGKTLTEAQEMVREAYVNAKILPEGRERIFVSLMQQRQYRVMVFRQETGGLTSAGVGGIILSTKRNSGSYVDLPAYENDVLSALSQTGGLPGLETFNEIIIFKGGMNNAAAMDALNKVPAGKAAPDLSDKVDRVIRISMKAKPGEPLGIRPEDILLNSGDVVFLEARDADLFFTGGLLPVGQYTLPRDYDLDVIRAIAQVKGPLVNGAFGTNGLAGNLIEPGLGNPSPSMLVVLRKTPGCGQVPILVDLNRALRDPRERILVKAGDVLILQERPSEAFARYLTRTVANFTISWRAISDRFVTGVGDFSAPERLANRVTVVQ